MNCDNCSALVTMRQEVARLRLERDRKLPMKPAPGWSHFFRVPRSTHKGQASSGSVCPVDFGSSNQY